MSDRTATIFIITFYVTVAALIIGGVIYNEHLERFGTEYQIARMNHWFKLGTIIFITSAVTYAVIHALNNKDK